MLKVFRFRSLASLAVVSSLVLSAAASESATKSAPKPQAKPSVRTLLAPADQYFGPGKMSIVGMNTAIVNLGERYHVREIEDTDIVHDAKVVEAAIYLWHDKYPKDMGAISTAFKLEQLYQVVQSTNARSHATTVLKFIAKAAPQSSQAHLSRLRLAQGFPPLATETATHATPNPYTQEANGASSAPVAAATTAADAATSPAPALSPSPPALPSTAPVLPSSPASAVPTSPIPTTSAAASVAPTQPASAAPAHT